MSKAAAYEAEAQQQQSLYPRVEVQPSYYAPQPAYGQPAYAQPMPMGGQYGMQAYPPGNPSVVVINQIPRVPMPGWRDPGCCTVCWGVTLLVCNIMSAISLFCMLGFLGAVFNNISNPSRCDPVYQKCPPAFDPTGNIAYAFGRMFRIFGGASANYCWTLILSICVVVFYCKKVTSPAARAWNYACWILIALSQTGIVLIMVTLGTLATAGSAFLSTIIHNAVKDSNATGAFDGVILAINISLWVSAIICAIPMIISSVVAHQNRAPCRCSGRPDYVD